jgi:hypothetical protein
MSSDQINIKSDQLTKQELIIQLEKQIEAGIWIQVIGILTEAIAYSKLVSLKEDSISARKIETGLWIQTVGQIIEALGVSKETASLDKTSIQDAQKMVIAGDLLQSAGAALEFNGGIEIFSDASNAIIP